MKKQNTLAGKSVRISARFVHGEVSHWYSLVPLKTTEAAKPITIYNVQWEKQDGLGQPQGTAMSMTFALRWIAFLSKHTAAVEITIAEAE